MCFGIFSGFMGFLGFSLGKRGLKWVLAEEKGFFMEIFEQREGEGLGRGYHSNQRLEQSHDRVDHSPWWTKVPPRQTYLAIVLKREDNYTMLGIYAP